ncbi:hypothetical protein GobsT_21970 [Gemmata obscuriglobus]|uniref:DUF5658 domain-containing protein n=1 Tax=Gemmata obscuriglobus TaxID=114 RepID=A0A2Z3H0D8_9BACT|nr:hypothetical protein [Gemmata obscuriglobus]AWM39473.1 hypothetical protein C1280_22425 [Gemmata obscuriglobus]QEG27441.1 hypothetical protein GobsT_21970 [Gemmata obscuriglobus]VTS04401.1 unnamed protein product [Gemmata obscuriglobus UQM 2246]
MTIRSRLWLLLPAVTLCAVDIGLTLVGQSGEYWLGQYESAHEANPFARPALARGPVTFASFGFAYAAVVVAVVCWWRSACVWVAALVTVAHAVGGAGWLVRFGPWGWGAAVVFLLAAAEGSARCWRRATRRVEHGGAPGAAA